ncbi:DUF397 domain-containing protein [Microbispora cellulosiformans]|uniref:DUF397 domain-containing protein n=1 Tax=Microbispora cellulosiformans TaxID=2614688 RepID=A0A5J5JYL5_9ACTN|nr:DUF397 domain-containing protein [Microbispora cellulosiformans]KAA9375961.1 DUF397 domain-containing protein [Microbispora cellulosiformans]
MTVPGPLGVGVYDGLEVEYQTRGALVYVRDPRDASHGYVRVSLARWSRFVGAVKARQFVPQQEGDVVTVTIGDLWNAGIVTASAFLVTSAHTWEIFCRAVRAGAFDAIDATSAAGQGEYPSDSAGLASG